MGGRHERAVRPLKALHGNQRVYTMTGTVAVTNRRAKPRRCTHHGGWTCRTCLLDASTTMNERARDGPHTAKQTYVSVQRNYTLATSATVSVHSWSIATPLHLRLSFRSVPIPGWFGLRGSVMISCSHRLHWTVSQSKPSDGNCKQLRVFPNWPSPRLPKSQDVASTVHGREPQPPCTNRAQGLVHNSSWTGGRAN